MANLRKRFTPSIRIIGIFRRALVMASTMPTSFWIRALEQIRIIPDCSVNIRKKVIMIQTERVRPPFKLKI
ncbi:MAG: hypothetical protein SCALA701_35830 [Candidatus Scalindua sp.]|nr:MAG: hypothetical protein SCALA701_35830 [Candidatus Scalindua sp.]